MRRKLSICLLTLLFSFSKGEVALSGDTEYIFTRIDVHQGLSHNQVYSVFKDSQGFMWFGTNFGLNRFDGYSFKVLRHIPSDLNSLTDNRIRNIFEGPSGKLWVSLLESFIIYDPATDEFSHNSPLFHKNIEIPVESISRISKDNQGNIWFLSDELGIFLYRPEIDSVVFLTKGSAYSDIHLDAVSAVQTDSEGNAWLIGFYGMIEKLDLSTLKVVFRTDFLNRLFPEWRALRFFVDRDNDLWVYSLSSDEGVMLYRPESDTHKHIHLNSRAPSLSSNIINTMVQADNGLLWIGTDHGGINILNKDDFTVRVLQHDENDERSISQNSITTLYKDDEGIIWAGTFKKGICYYHEDLFKFKLFRHKQNDPFSLPFDDVNCFQEDEKGNLWIGTNGNGFCYYDRKADRYQIFRHNPNDPNSLSNNVIVSMLYDRNQQLWLGTFYGGLNRFDGKNFKHFNNKPEASNSLADDRVWEIHEDVLGNIWIGTLGGGLELYDPLSETFRHFRAGEPNSIHSDYILHIQSDQEGNLWIGSANGIDYFNRTENTFTFYTHQPGDTSSLSNMVANSVLLDSRGLLWVATQEGLNVLLDRKGIFRRYYIEDGLPDNTILAVIEDDQGNIWLSTTKGITNIRVLHYENGKEPELRFINYNEADGLQGKEFNEGVVFKTKVGELIFGGPDGFNLFKPSELTYNQNPPAVIFTDLQVLNKTIGIGQELNGRVLLEKSLSEMETIVLKHSENIFALEFSALNFIHPEKNQFEYMLKGFNREWIHTSSNERKATYTNLDPGEYVFSVRASNNDGVWNEEGISLKIVVRPPLWKTKGAIVFYILCLIAALFLLRFLILQRERLKFRIEQDKIEAQRRHELDLLKIRFFTNVSHEFRTPLSLIISPLERMLKNPGKEQDQQSHLKLIYRNARRLLNLVNQLLDFRRMEVQKINLKPSYGDIINFIHEIYISFTDLAERKDIKFTFESSHTSFFTYFDQDKLEKIIFNLLSNAFKFTPEGKTINLTADLPDEENRLLPIEAKSGMNSTICIRVSDTGLGIPAENLEKIFDRFFQDDASGNVISQGSGIGLSLTRDFVLLHNGTIEVESELHQGSTFIVKLPLLNDAPAKDTGIEEVPIPKEKIDYETAEGENVPERKQAASILLVEDNDDFRFYLKDNLKATYTIFEASNGREGLEKAGQHLPDLIVSDVMMPEMDGFELCKALKTNPNTSHIPVILLTARMAEQKKLEGFETGADDYITKPFSFELLESRINNLIHLRQRIKDSFQKHFKIEPGEITITSLDEKLLNKTLELVEQNMSNSEFSVEKLSRELGMSRVHLYKKLTALTGKTPIEFIRIMRLKRAAQLLEKSQLTIAEVAYEVGFNDPRYFSKYFKSEFGMLPSQYIHSKK